MSILPFGMFMFCSVCCSLIASFALSGTSSPLSVLNTLNPVRKYTPLFSSTNPANCLLSGFVLFILYFLFPMSKSAICPGMGSKLPLKSNPVLGLVPVYVVVVIIGGRLE